MTIHGIPNPYVYEIVCPSVIVFRDIAVSSYLGAVSLFIANQEPNTDHWI